jgi:hypothetical protein
VDKRRKKYMVKFSNNLKYFFFEKTVSTLLGVYLFLELGRVRVGYMYTFHCQV